MSKFEEFNEIFKDKKRKASLLKTFQKFLKEEKSALKYYLFQILLIFIFGYAIYSTYSFFNLSNDLRSYNDVPFLIGKMMAGFVSFLVFLLSGTEPEKISFNLFKEMYKNNKDYKDLYKKIKELNTLINYMFLDLKNSIPSK
jgi:hypothetical protein